MFFFVFCMCLRESIRVMGSMTHDTMSFIGQTRSNAVANVLKIGHCRKRIVFSSRLVNYTLVNDNGRLAIFSENDGLRFEKI